MNRLAWVLVLASCGGRTGVHEPVVHRDAGRPDVVDAGELPDVHELPVDTGCGARLAPLPSWAVAPSSVELTMTFSWLEEVSPPFGPVGEVTLALVPTSDGVLGVAHGADLRFSSAAALASERTRIGCAEAGCELSLETPSTACRDAARLVLRDLEVLARDVDCDGRADRLEGMADAAVLLDGEDGMSRRWIEGTVLLTARPDTTAPTLRLESADLPGAPLRSVRVVASEPLTASTSLDVLGMRSPPQRVVPDPRGWITSAVREWPAPFAGGETLYISADATLRDFVGHDAGADTRMMAWPGVATAFPEDGFESGEGIALQSGARWVDGIGRIPPIAGWRSLWLPPGQLPEAPETRWAFVRMAPARAASQLTFEVQFVGDTASVDPRARFEVTVFDALGRRGGALLSPRGRFEPTGEPGAPFASPPARETIPLTDVRAGTPLLVVLSATTVECGQPSPGAHGLLVDGMRLE